VPELARERCQVCTAGTPTLDPEEAERLGSELGGPWAIDAGVLRRRFAFPNFGAAFALATRVAMLAEREGHHPDLHVGWGYCEVELTTHAAGGLTRNDFIMAAKVERAAASPLGGGRPEG
jgi:4a-hydroxytetrahydrobiopterin dehydratase